MKKFWVARLRRLRHIDLAFVQALDQFVRGDVDQDHVVGALQHPVRHGLAHEHAGDPADHFGQAFEMLDIERRPHVEAGVEQFLDILPALGMAAVRRIGVGQFVHHDQRRAALQRRVNVEFLDLAAAIVDLFSRQDFEALEQRGGLGAPVGLDQADDHVDALGLDAAGAQQHRKGLADAGSGAEEDLQFAAALACPPAPAARRDRAGGRVRDPSP